MSDDDKIEIKDDGDTRSVYGKIAPDDGGMTLEEAARLRKDVLKNMTVSNRDSQLINTAGALMTGRQFGEAVKVYRTLLADYPERSGDAYNGIGACMYFLERFEDAIVYYKKALDHGADPRMVAYNIEEAEEAIDARG